MGKIILFFIFLILVMFFPVYEYFLQKPIKKFRVLKNIPIVNIYNGKFAIYSGELSKIGCFVGLDVYRKYYLGYNLNVNDLIKKEYYKAKKVKFKKSVVYANVFYYKNDNYILDTSKVIYFLKKKLFKGKKFYLTGKDFNATGKSFLIDKYKNIKATNIIFNLKVNK